MAFTEFYCNASTGSNINAGDLTANGVVTSTNGDWDNAAANRFTAASGTPFSGVSVGNFASVYLDGATVAVYIGRVTAVNGGGASLDISATAKSGTKPSAGATGRSCTTGGAWKGPNGTEAFPLNFVENTMVNSSSHPVRVNLQNTATYNITAGITIANSYLRFQGYTTTVGDFGRAILDGGTTNATLLTVSGGNNCLADLIVQNNATGTAIDGILSSGQENLLLRCVTNGIRRRGFSFGTNDTAIECEAYACNGANQTASGGFYSGGLNRLIRCISHDNVGSNSAGFYTVSAPHYSECIADTNGGAGFQLLTTLALSLSGCASYNNTGSGYLLTNSSGSAPCVLVIENNAAVSNGGWGIEITGAQGIQGIVQNCGFHNNTSGTLTFGAHHGIVEIGSVTLGAVPWADAPNGDFRITLAAAKGTGRGTYTQTAASYAGTIGYPDIGTAQHQDTGGGAGLARIIGG